MRFEALKVGELAKRTGLTVRTLHHYDEVGLLRPSLHTESGHRLYTAGDIARLQQVLSLRQLGFSLEEIAGCLDRPGFSPMEVIRLHVARLRDQIALQRSLCERLEAVAAHFEAAGEVSADEFIRTIEEMTMIESYYTPEQLETLKARGEQLGPDRIRQSQEDWAELIAEVRAEMEKGTAPAAPEVQALARRWMDLVNAFTGGDPGIRSPWDACGRSKATPSPRSTTAGTIRVASPNTSAGRWRPRTSSLDRSPGIRRHGVSSQTNRTTSGAKAGLRPSGTFKRRARCSPSIRTDCAPASRLWSMIGSFAKRVEGRPDRIFRLPGSDSGFPV